MNQRITQEKTKHHAEIISNRVKKRYAHLRKSYARKNIDCFRLYDWDIPEVRAVVDWYKGHLVVAEYVRTQTSPDWLPYIAQAIGETLNVSRDKIFIKKRRTKTGDGARYQKMGSKNFKIEVSEFDLKFWVNLNDFLDTGLFSDHRQTRALVKEWALDQDFLNLYAYTGAFTCAAALGSAKSTVTVDRSATYIDWAKENLALNGISDASHHFIQSDVNEYLRLAQNRNQTFSLAFIDPPSFFQDQAKKISFDINRDHPQLIKDVLKLMRPGSTIIFSANHQQFEPNFDELLVNNIRELTPKTIPEDYRNKKVHRCWIFRK